MHHIQKFTFLRVPLVLTSLSLLASCSTAHVRVLPGDDGVNKVVSTDLEKEGAEKAAVEAAEEHCAKQNKMAVFVTEKSEYTGKMDEETRRTVRKASTAAQVLGGIHSPVGDAGRAGHIMTNDRDYRSEVSFKCK